MAEDSLIDPDDKPISLDDEEPISLVESEGPSEFGEGGMRAFGTDADEVKDEKAYQRTLNTDGTGATRCRIFHSKIAIASLEFMEGQINEWLDGEQIEVKQVGHIIGTMEGKRPEPNLLVIVWH